MRKISCQGVWYWEMKCKFLKDGAVGSLEYPTSVPCAKSPDPSWHIKVADTSTTIHLKVGVLTGNTQECQEYILFMDIGGNELADKL